MAPGRGTGASMPNRHALVSQLDAGDMTEAGREKADTQVPVCQTPVEVGGTGPSFPDSLLGTSLTSLPTFASGRRRRLEPGRLAPYDGCGPGLKADVPAS